MIAHLCDKTITIQQNIGTLDGAGDTPASWVSKYRNVAARVRPVTASERAQYGGLPTICTHIVYLTDATLDVTEHDRILWFEQDKVFNIVGVRNPSEQGAYLILDCEEIRA